jgi:hypothetical protein
MERPRSAFGVASIGKYIYAVAGDNNDRTTERYDIFEDKWEILPDLLDGRMLGHTLISFISRYFLIIGGMNSKTDKEKRKHRLYVMDTWKTVPTWEVLPFNSSSGFSMYNCQVGVLKYP